MPPQFVLRQGRRYLRMDLSDHPRLRYMKLLGRQNNLDPATRARRWARHIARRALRDMNETS